MFFDLGGGKSALPPEKSQTRFSQNLGLRLRLNNNRSTHAKRALSSFVNHGEGEKTYMLFS